MSSILLYTSVSIVRVKKLLNDNNTLVFKIELKSIFFPEVPFSKMISYNLHWELNKIFTILH